MPTWVFALIVLGIGVGLAMLVDGLKLRPGGRGEPRDGRERVKWLYFWFVGRFPTKDEQSEDEKQAQKEEQDRRNAERRLRK